MVKTGGEVLACDDGSLEALPMHASEWSAVWFRNGARAERAVAARA